MVKIRLLALPSTARVPGPGPRMVMELVMEISPVVNRILPETPVENVIALVEMVHESSRG